MKPSIDLLSDAQGVVATARLCEVRLAEGDYDRALELADAALVRMAGLSVAIDRERNQAAIEAASGCTHADVDRYIDRLSASRPFAGIEQPSERRLPRPAPIALELQPQQRFRRRALLATSTAITVR